MSASRRLSLPAHGATEFLVGMAMMLVPIGLSFGPVSRPLGFSPVSLLVTGGLGAVLAGMGLALSASRRGTWITWHGHFDTLFIVASALAALALAIVAQPLPAAFLAAVVVVQASLAYATRYAT
jgi:hypothetical protein